MRSILCLLAVFISGTHNHVHGLSKQFNLEANRTKKDVFNMAMQFVVQPWNLRQTPNMVKKVLNTINVTINEEENMLNYVSAIIKKLQTELSHTKNVSLNDLLLQSTITEKELSDIDSLITDDRVVNIKKIHPQVTNHSDLRPNAEKGLAQNASHALKVKEGITSLQKEQKNTLIIKIKKLKTPSVKENDLMNVNESKNSRSNIYSVFNKTDLEHRQVPYEEVFKSSLDSTYENTSEINKENLTGTDLYVIGLRDKEGNRSRVGELNIVKASVLLFVSNNDTPYNIFTFENGLKFLSPLFLGKNGKLKTNVTKYVNNNSRLPNQSRIYTFNELRKYKEALKNKIPTRNLNVLLPRNQKNISLDELERNERLPNNDVEYLTNTIKSLSGQVFNTYAEKRHPIKQNFTDKPKTNHTLKNIAQKIQKIKRSVANIYDVYKNKEDPNFHMSGHDIGELNANVKKPVKNSKKKVNKTASGIDLKNDEILQRSLFTATKFSPTIVSPEFETAELSKTTIEEIFNELDKRGHNISKRFYLFQPIVNRNPQNEFMLKLYSILKLKNLKSLRCVNMKKLVNDIFNKDITQNHNILTNPKQGDACKEKINYKSIDNIRSMNKKLRQSNSANKGNLKVFDKNYQLGYVTRYFLKDTDGKHSQILRFSPQTSTHNEKRVSKVKCLTCSHDTFLDMTLVNARKEWYNSNETPEFKNKISESSSKTIELSKLFPPKSRQARSLGTIFLDSRQVRDNKRPQVTLLKFKQHNVNLVQSPSFSLDKHEFNDLRHFAIRDARDNIGLLLRTAYKQEQTLNSNRRQNGHLILNMNLAENRTSKFPVLYNIRKHGLMNNPTNKSINLYNSSYRNYNKMKSKHSLRPRDLLGNDFGNLDYNDPNIDGTENLSVDINNVDISDDLVDQIDNLGVEITTLPNKYVNSQNYWHHYFLIDKARTAKKKQEGKENLLRFMNANKEQVKSYSYPKKKHQHIFEDFRYKLKPEYDKFHSEDALSNSRLRQFAEEFNTNKEVSRSEEEYRKDNRSHPMHRFYAKDNNEMQSDDNFLNFKIISNRVPEFVVETDGYIHHNRLKERLDFPKNVGFIKGENCCHDDFEIDSEQVEEEKDTIFKKLNDNYNDMQPKVPYADEFVKKYESNNVPNWKNHVPISLTHKISPDKKDINSSKLFSELTSQIRNSDKKRANVDVFDLSTDEMDVTVKSSTLSSEAFILIREKKQNADKSHATTSKDEVSVLETQTIPNVLPVKLHKQDSMSVNEDWEEVAPTLAQSNERDVMSVKTHEQNMAVSDWEDKNISLYELSGSNKTHQENKAVSDWEDNYISLYELPSATTESFLSSEKKYTDSKTLFPKFTFKPDLQEKDQLFDSDYQYSDMPSKPKPAESAIQSKTPSYMPLSHLSRAMLPEKKTQDFSSFFQRINEKQRTSVSAMKDDFLDTDYYQDSNMATKTKTVESTTKSHPLLYVPLSRGILPEKKEYKNFVSNLPSPKNDPFLNTNYHDSNLPPGFKLGDSATLSNSPTLTPLSQNNPPMLSEEKEYRSSFEENRKSVLLKKDTLLNTNYLGSSLPWEMKLAESTTLSNSPSFTPLSQKSRATLPEEKEYTSSVPFMENIFKSVLPKEDPLLILINNQDSNLSSETKLAESAVSSSFPSFTPFSKMSMFPEEKEYTSSVSFVNNIIHPILSKIDSMPSKSKPTALSSQTFSSTPVSKMSREMMPVEKRYSDPSVFRRIYGKHIKSDLPMKYQLLRTGYQNSNMSVSQTHRETPYLHNTTSTLTSHPSKSVITNGNDSIETSVHIEKKRKKQKKNISHNSKHILALWSKHNYKDLNISHWKGTHLLDMWHHDSLGKHNYEKQPSGLHWQKYQNRIQDNYDEYRPPEEEFISERKKRSKRSPKKRHRKRNRGRGSSRRLLCIVMRRTDQGSLVPHIQNTWGKRCNVLIFVTTMFLSDNEEETWRYTRAVLKYIKKKYRRYADWFLKTDIDTYVAISNLKKIYLRGYSLKIPLFLGCSGAHNIKSFIINKKALSRLTSLGPKTKLCISIQDTSVDGCLDFLNIYRMNNTYCNKSDKMSIQQFLYQADHQPLGTAIQKFNHKKVFLEQVTVEDMYLIQYYLHRRQSDTTPKTIMVRSRLIDGAPLRRSA